MSSPEIQAAAEQIHDALDAVEDCYGYHARTTGVIDMMSDELATALLAAGWQPPDRPA